MMTLKYQPLFPWIAPLILIAVALTISVGLTGRANAAPPLPADVQKTLYEIGDLELIRALQPLKLTAAQIETLSKPMKEILASGEKERKADYDAILALAAEVTKARAAALGGEPIPADMDAKVRKASEASSERFEAAKKTAISKIYNLALTTLDDPQKEEIVRQVIKMLEGRRPIPKEFKDKPNLAPKDKVQEVALGIYTERVLILERVPEILSKMKPAVLPPPDAAKP